MSKKSNCNHSVESPCPIRGIIEIISKRWTICITSLLEPGKPMRYSELKNKLRGISPKTLSDTLKVLENENFIERRVYPETPPRVDYSLTEEGVELKQAIMPLVRWTQKRGTPHIGDHVC